MKKIIAINASPRTGWNTAALVREAARGAEAQGAEVEVIDLYRLERFTGCISCFACKLEATKGKCVYRDALAPVLEKIRQADGLILGGPNYLGDFSAGFRALYERLIFQSLTYEKENMNCNTHPIPVLLIMTSNAPESAYAPELAYGQMLAGYQRSLSTFIGPTKTVVYGSTLQVNDYSKYNWTMFDAAAQQAKRENHEKVLPQKKEQVFALGADMVTAPWQ